MAIPALVDPVQAYFLPGEPGLSAHKLGNPNPWVMAVKVRCSDNSLYRVHPVFALIQPGEWRQLEVARFPAPAKTDKLVVQSLPAPEGATPPDLPQYFRSSICPPGVNVALVAAEAPDEAPFAAPAVTMTYQQLQEFQTRPLF